MNHQGWQYNSPFPNINIIDGDPKQNEYDIKEYENKEELINNPEYFLQNFVRYNDCRIYPIILLLYFCQVFLIILV